MRKMKMMIFIENGFEDSEFIYPYYRFQEEGYKLDIVAPKANQKYTGEHGVSFTSEMSPEQVNLDGYDAVIIPGGKAPDRMRLSQGLVNIVKDSQPTGDGDSGGLSWSADADFSRRCPRQKRDELALYRRWTL
jgi:protease I